MMQNDQLKKHFQITNIYLDKVSNHLKNENYIEAFLLMSAIMEKELSLLIKEQENSINDKLSEDKEKIDFTKYHRNKETLGELIKHLSALGFNIKFINDLEQFNFARIKCVHRLFQVDPECLNNELKENFQKYKILNINVIKKLRTLMVDEMISTKKKLKILKHARNILKKTGKNKISIIKKRKTIIKFKPTD